MAEIFSPYDFEGAFWIRRTYHNNVSPKIMLGNKMKLGYNNKIDIYLSSKTMLGNNMKLDYNNKIDIFLVCRNWLRI